MGSAPGVGQALARGAPCRGPQGSRLAAEHSVGEGIQQVTVQGPLELGVPKQNGQVVPTGGAQYRRQWSTQTDVGIMAARSVEGP